MRSTILFVSLAGLVCGAACAVNPATGKKELALVSESQEVQMGLQADPGIITSMGLDPDSGRQRYVRALGIYPGPVPVATVALVNNVDPGDRFAAGSLAKRIVGDPLP